MVSGCGMNGRSREPRSSSGGPPTKKHTPSHNQRAPHKPRPPAEALQMARILEDSKHTSELNSKVQSVQSVVPGCTEEQIHLALHDNGYDLDKAISALLDSDGQTNEGEWTTTSSRKTRKKGAQGDTEESAQTKATSGRSSNRAASSGTRESHGGSVTLISGRGRGQSNRSKGQSAGKRTRVGVISGDQRRSRNRDRDKPQTSSQQPLPSKGVSEEWDILPVISPDQGAGDAPLTDSWSTGGVWTSQLADRSPDTKFWEADEPQEDTEQEEVVSELQPVFPEAIPGQEILHSTPSEITPSLPSTGSVDRDPSVQQTPSESRDKVPRKTKRLARSQIPKKPVEMPAGIESLDVQFGELGIDFVGLDTQSPPPETKEITVETGMGGLLPYSDLQQNFGDGISTSSSSTGLGGSEGTTVHPLEHSPYSERQIPAGADTEMPISAGLRSPPGLPHPSSSGEQQPVEPAPTALPLPDEVTSSQQSSIDSQLHLQEVPPSTTVLKPTPIELPLELPSRQTNPTTTAIEQPFSSVSNTGSDKLLFSSSPSVTPSVTSSSSTSSRPSSVTPSSLPTQHHQHHPSQQQGKPGSSGSVPPGMLYPHMMPAQYPFIPAPAMYNYDPNEMSRYSSGSMAYFPTSSDPSMGGAMASRDHTSSVFPAQSEQAKFPRGGADLSSAVAVSSTQQSQQGSGLQQPGATGQPGSGQMGPAFMGGHFYGNMFYPTMYGPVPAFSQAANFGMTYEEMVAVAAGAAPASHDYSKMYASGSGGSLNKPSSLPVSSSGGIDSSTLATSSYKHIESNKSFNYSVPTGVGGSQAPGYYMQMPFPPMMVGPGGHEVGGVTPHSRISQQKHSSKVGGYQGNSGSASYWGSAAAHTS